MYITNKELYYETLVSKAKGDCTPNLTKYFLLLANKLVNTKLYNPTLQEDMEHDIIMRLLDSYYHFDEDKGRNPFAYFTEIAKRAASATYNDHNKHQEGKHIIPDYI